ncbi:MAG: VanZ family protein [Actinobacteria bacterium]|nr:VanZ family protein [Actinomycetota bacterium]
MSVRLLLPTDVYAAILALSSLPADDLSMLPAGLSLVGHALEYAVLGTALRWALDGVPGATAVTLGAVACLAGIDEAYQSTVPGRDPSALDWLVDVTSGAVAATAFVRGRG